MRSGQLVEPGQTADVLIIGGGAIGLTIARALAQRGVPKVTVTEKHEFGREASWAAGGILAPQVEADRQDDFFASPVPVATCIRSLPRACKLIVTSTCSSTRRGPCTWHSQKPKKQNFAPVSPGNKAREWLSSGWTPALPVSLNQIFRNKFVVPSDFQTTFRSRIAA